MCGVVIIAMVNPNVWKFEYKPSISPRCSGFRDIFRASRKVLRVFKQFHSLDGIIGMVWPIRHIQNSSIFRSLSSYIENPFALSLRVVQRPSLSGLLSGGFGALF